MGCINKTRVFATVFGIGLSVMSLGCAATNQTTEDEKQAETVNSENTVDSTVKNEENIAGNETVKPDGNENKAENSKEEEAKKEESTQKEEDVKKEEESKKDEAIKADLINNAVIAYNDMLFAAPALKGEHAELDDAGFGYEENQEMFGEHMDYYVLRDLNQDEIPELITASVMNFRWIPISVFTYTDGKVVLVKEETNPDTIGTLEQRSTANGAYDTYFCDEGHIHSVWRGTDPDNNPVEENKAYVLEDTVLKAVECSTGENENTLYFWNLARENQDETEEISTFSFEGTLFRYGEQVYDVAARVDGINSITDAVSVGDKIVVYGHVGPKNEVYCIFDTAMRAFEKDLVGTNLIWQDDDIETAVYNFWSDIIAYDGTILHTIELEDSEYISELTFSEDDTKLFVRIYKGDEERTEEILVTVD